MVSTSGPGIFLQGLAVHGVSGELLPGAALDRAVVAAAFDYAERTGTPLCAFLGDTCSTLRLTPELEVRTHACGALMTCPAPSGGSLVWAVHEKAWHFVLSGQLGRQPVVQTC